VVVLFGVRSEAVAWQQQQLGGVFFLVHSEAVARQRQHVVVISFGSVLRLLLGSNNNEVMFSFWYVPRL
jgi:hypothetical protein